MRVDVVMPQMGESIAEGTITRWIKKQGEKVQRDEPLFEISTDKVDAEIPAPAAGTLVEVRNREGETVPVNQVVAIIDTEGKAAASPEKSAVEKPAAEQTAARTAAPEKPRPQEAAPKRPVPDTPRDREVARERTGERTADAEPLGAFVSPVVRRIASEHGIDPGRVPGTGTGGRVTKKDILDFIASGADAPSVRETRPAAEAPPAPRRQPDAPTFSAGKVERVAMSPMRKKIAEHMVASKRTSAHVHSVFEVDMSRLVALRDKYRPIYEQRHGTRLTYMPFFIRAACHGLRAWPVVNASVEGEEIVYKRDLNVGIAVALDWGLIVPVIHNADELSVAGLAKKVHDLAERARTKKLNPDEVQGGTFTLTNPGVFGGLYGLPIINQPQVAILGIGGIQKRAVVVNDAIAIRPMVYVSMSYDHRAVDGAVADQFLGTVKGTLEDFDESLL